MRSRGSGWLVLLVVGVIGSSVAPAPAQTVTGSLFGTLTDDSKARLPGVRVTVESTQLVAGQETRVSSTDGQYRFPALPPGTYTVSFELQGFQTLKREGIILLAGQSLAVDGTLAVAKLTDNVVVQANSQLIDTRSAAVMNTVDSATLDAIPIARTFTQLLDLTPGVTGGQTAHGSTARQNAYNVDGLNTNDPNTSGPGTDLPVDAFQEVQVTTAGVPAEFGEASGAVFNYITKSGGNTFRGMAQIFYQSKELASNNVSP
jgi:hypothetical protein